MANCTEKTAENTAKKIKRTLTITTNHGDTFSISDSDDEMTASLLLAQFKRGGVLNFTDNGDEYFVPSASVDSIKVEIAADSE